MSLAETELTINGTSFKGVYIAILLSLATTLGGGVWTASSLYSRLEAVENVQIPDIVPLTENILLVEKKLSADISLIDQKLEDNDVSQLQGKLATLGVSLQTIAEQQNKLLLINEKVISLEKDIETMRATVAQAEMIGKDFTNISNDFTDLEAQMKKISTEIEDLWSGMDYLSNPLK
jgi:DNA repair exonuclease SbcCD ATPase subunit